MADEIGFDRLVGRIYDSVTSPTGFQEFVAELVTVLDLKAAMILTANNQTGEGKGLWAVGMEPHWIERYALEFTGEDLLVQHLITAPPAHFYATNLDLDEHAFGASRFYREWVIPQNVACAWCSQVILQRRPDQAAFTRDELERCNRLIPHLQRAIQMRQRFSELQLGNLSSDAHLDIIAMPSLLIDETGRVAQVNRAAKDLLAADSTLQCEDGHVRTHHPELTRRLNVQIIAAVNACRGDIAHAPGLVLVPRPGRRPLTLMVAPLRVIRSCEIRGGALLFIYDTELTPSLTAELVGRLFNLTDAEAQLAVALCAGLTLDNVAMDRGTSLHTVRSQLKSLFNKTGTKRQADLIVLLLSSPAYFLSTAEST